MPEQMTDTQPARKWQRDENGNLSRRFNVGKGSAEIIIHIETRRPHMFWRVEFVSPHHVGDWIATTSVEAAQKAATRRARRIAKESAK